MPILIFILSYVHSKDKKVRKFKLKDVQNEIIRKQLQYLRTRKTTKVDADEKNKTDTNIPKGDDIVYNLQFTEKRKYQTLDEKYENRHKGKPYNKTNHLHQTEKYKVEEFHDKNFSPMPTLMPAPYDDGMPSSHSNDMPSPIPYITKNKSKTKPHPVFKNFRKGYRKSP